MINFKNIYFSIGGVPLFENASGFVPTGHKVGVVGSNGAGKTTLFKLILNEIILDAGVIEVPKNYKIGYVSQEAPSTEVTLLDTVLEADIERSKLLYNAQIEKDPNKIAEIYTRLSDINAYSAEARASSILNGLGISKEDLIRPCSSFSGGWRMRVALASVLFSNPELLLLDEPTNHLDLDTIFWLEEYLSSLKIAIIIISHDRYFLDKLCKKIIFIDRGISEIYNGNYSFFVEQKFLNEESQNKAYQLQQKEIQIQKKYIDRFRASATRSSQAKSREKQLKKIPKIEAPKAKSKSPAFNFPDCPRSGKLVLNIKNLSHSYEDRILFLDVNLKISSGEKIALLGPNGSGKSTLLKIIMKKISPEIGEINLGKHNIITSYYEQNQAEALSLEQRVIDLICYKSPDWSQKKVRTFLGGFGFQNETVFKYIKQLSGGEKARLALALMIINPSNFLLLDEPTNHLDLQSKENLELAIKNYKGSLLIISHDRYFISKVANRIIEIKDSKLFSYDGNYEYFLEKTQSQKI